MTLKKSRKRSPYIASKGAYDHTGDRGRQSPDIHAIEARCAGNYEIPLTAVDVRYAVTLYDKSDRSARQVASILGITERTVVRHRAKRRKHTEL